MNTPELVKNGLRAERDLLKQGEYYQMQWFFGYQEDVAWITSLRKQAVTTLGRDCELMTDELEDTICDLNAALGMSNLRGRISAPLPNNTDHYLIKFDNGIIAVLEIVDEYCGKGESIQAVSVDRFLVRQDTEPRHLVDVAKWLNAVITGK